MKTDLTNKLFSKLFLGILVLYGINIASTFFRYTEIYQLILPKNIEKFFTFSPQTWRKGWRFGPLMELLEQEDPEMTQQVAVVTDSFDRAYFSFNLFPRPITSNFDQVSLHWAVIVPNPQQPPKLDHWKIVGGFHDYLIWKR